MRAHYLLYLNFVLAFASVDAAVNNVQSSLRRNLFANYDRLVKPDGQVAMELGLSIINLAYCPVTEKMYTTVWLRQSWMDNRLAWNPADWDGIQHLRLPAEEVWTPDLSNYKGKIEVIQTSVYDKMTRAVVSEDGKVVHVPVMKISSHCPKPVALPEDPTEHNCTLSLGSWTYDVAEIDPDFKGDAVDFKFLTNKKVEILDKGIEKIEKEYECCPGQKYVSLHFWFQFKQEAGKKGKMWGGGHGGFGKGRGGTRPMFSGDDVEEED